MREHLQEGDGMRGRKNLSFNSSCVSTSNREKLRCYCTYYRPVLGTSGTDVVPKGSWVPTLGLGREIKVSRYLYDFESEQLLKFGTLGASNFSTWSYHSMGPITQLHMLSLCFIP